jgi:hypothetical protein
MDLKEIIDEVVSKVSPEIVKSVGTLSAEGYKKVWQFFKKKFAKEETVKQLEATPSLPVEKEAVAGLSLAIEKRYLEDKEFKNGLDKLLRNNYTQENRTINQSGKNSVYIENTSGDINFN